MSSTKVLHEWKNLLSSTQLHARYIFWIALRCAYARRLQVVYIPLSAPQLTTLPSFLPHSHLIPHHKPTNSKTEAKS
jgi:hypothetical protein